MRIFGAPLKVTPLIGVVAAATATACGAASQAIKNDTAGGLKLVACNSVIAATAKPTPGRRIVLGRLVLPREGHVLQGRADQRNRPLPFFAKQGLEVLASRVRVDVIVPEEWRRRAAVSWGENGGPGQVSHVRFLGCAPVAGRRWLSYPGGYFLREPACLPLVVRIGRSVARVRLSIGRRCG